MAWRGDQPAKWVTKREPEWDEFDRAMVDAVLDWRADLHTCGRPLSEALWDSDKDSPEYVVSHEICLACQALDKDDAEKAAEDEAMHKGGRHPESWRVKTVRRFEELGREQQAAILAGREMRKSGRPAQT